MNPTLPTLHLRPVGELLVRDPLTRERLPQAGAVVPKSSFWMRRLREGSVEEVPEPKTKSKPAAAPRSIEPRAKTSK